MKKILAVDDDGRIRSVLAAMLNIWIGQRNIEAEVTILENGAEALAWIHEHGKPDILLLDVRMPVMNGGEFLQQVSGLGLDFSGSTLLLTGYADDLEEYLGQKGQVMHHLRKPFKATELFEALDKLKQSYEQS